VNVLVLGVGGNVSQGILKVLALSDIPTRVIGACIDPRSFGLYTVEKAYVSPRADDPAFLVWLIDICQKENIHAILSGVEPVLTVLSIAAERIRAETGAVCVVASKECLEIADDKLLTCQWLQSNGFAFPRFADVRDPTEVDALVLECGYELIAKPRFGKGARGVFVVRDEATLAAAMRLPGYMLEEYLGDASQEYTVGCFNDVDGNVRGAIVMRRELLEGTTLRAEVGEFPDVRAEAIGIAERLACAGPSNIQMRLHRGRPTCFEINMRFSGTTPMRARLGFNDVAAALENFVLGRPAHDMPVITSGIALRYWNEAYPDPKDVLEFERSRELPATGRPALEFEDYGFER
jgi:carbamoyl-phosphate synthase large subunit